MSDDIYPNTITVIHRSERIKSKSPDLRILHYNDVYHIEPGSAEPCGGISRFQEVVSHYRFHPKYASAPHLTTLFSGDAFNPSLESTVTKGRHMVSVLNSIGTDAACIGNHDLDFGVPQFEYLSGQCRFPWLLANVLDPDLGEGRALGNCKRTTIIESSNGIKIGLIGLGEREWLDTINSLPPNLIYKSASETAKELVPGLRAAGAEIIIALTHQRDPNDIKLAEKVPAGLIDIILGGHDHHYTHVFTNECHVLCSGSDFKQLSYLEATRKPSGKGWDFDIIRHDIGRTIKENEGASELVRELTSDLRKTLEEPIGYTAVPLDGRFSTIRVKESNLGNFVCDLMRFYYGAECALMASGTIRGDQVYPPGIILLKDILNCFPFEDPVMVVKVTGKAIVDALENAVSKFPAYEGRFPQVSNIQFAYNPHLPPYKRVLWTKVHGEAIDLKCKYMVSTRGYMGRGKDGYTSLLAISEGGEAEEIVSEEQGVLISTIIRQYFLSLKVLGQWSQWGSHLNRHWNTVNSKLHAGGKIKKPGTSRDNSVSDFGSMIHSSEDGTEFALTRENSWASEGSGDHSSMNGYGGGGVGAGSANGSLLPFGIFGGGLRKENENRLARKYAERWMRRTGVRSEEGHGLGEEQTDSDKLPFWTQGIAPTVEGRIVLVDDAQLKGMNGQVADQPTVNIVGEGAKA